MREIIDFYEREHYYMSNFSSFSIKWKGKRYLTSEHAYHSEKFLHGTQPKIPYFGFENPDTTPSAHEALKLSHRFRDNYRPDWDEVKVSIMKEICRAKMKQHPYIQKKLLQTYHHELVEGSWRDDFWGWGPDKEGRNELGKIWMELRTELREKNEKERQEEI